MKARVKATGEIIELYRFSVVAEKGSGVSYTLEQLEFEAPFDYWEKLKHQYAGMAMQGLMSKEILDTSDSLSSHAIYYATALIEKLKNEK